MIYVNGKDLFIDEIQERKFIDVVEIFFFLSKSKGSAFESQIHLTKAQLAGAVEYTDYISAEA